MLVDAYTYRFSFYFHFSFCEKLSERNRVGCPDPFNPSRLTIGTATLVLCGHLWIVGRGPRDLSLANRSN